MMTYVILIVTVVVSIACFNNYSLFNKLSCNPYRMVHSREWYRIISHGFVHADWTHLILNMFTFLSLGYTWRTSLSRGDSVVPVFWSCISGEWWQPRYMMCGNTGTINTILPLGHPVQFRLFCSRRYFCILGIRSTSLRSFRFPVLCLVSSTCFIASTWQNETEITSIITPTSMERCSAWFFPCYWNRDYYRCSFSNFCGINSLCTKTRTSYYLLFRKLNLLYLYSSSVEKLCVR